MDLNINDEILINYRHLECVLTPIEKNKTHWISIKNFIYHLIENQAYKKKSNTELQRIGEKRIKKQLLAYFTEVNNKNIMSKKEESVSGINLEAFASRLRWLADKFKNIQRSSVAIGAEEKQLTDQASIDDLLANLGL